MVYHIIVDFALSEKVSQVSRLWDKTAEAVEVMSTPLLSRLLASDVCSDTGQTVMGLNTGPGAPTWHRGSETTHLPHHNHSSDQGGSWGMRRCCHLWADIMAHFEARCPAIQIPKTNIETRKRNKNKAMRFLVYFPISASHRVLMRPLLTHQRWCLHREWVCGEDFPWTKYGWMPELLVLGNTWTKWGDTVYAPLRCDWQSESIPLWRSRHKTHFLTIPGTPHSDCSSPGPVCQLHLI